MKINVVEEFDPRRGLVDMPLFSSLKTPDWVCVDTIMVLGVFLWLIYKLGMNRMSSY